MELINKIEVLTAVEQAMQKVDMPEVYRETIRVALCDVKTIDEKINDGICVKLMDDLEEYIVDIRYENLTNRVIEALAPELERIMYDVIEYPARNMHHSFYKLREYVEHIERRNHEN